MYLLSLETLGYVLVSYLELFWRPVHGRDNDDTMCPDAMHASRSELGDPVVLKNIMSTMHYKTSVT